MFISNVIHAAVMEVTEEGTVAAAVTVVVSRRKSYGQYVLIRLTDLARNVTVRMQRTLMRSRLK